MVEPVKQRSRSFLATTLLFCVLVQFFSRFAAAPVADFASDDWAFLARSLEAPSTTAALALAAVEPDRPFQAGILSATFRLFGDAPVRYALLSIAAYSLFLTLGLLLMHRLTACRTATMLFGILFSLFPNLTESFHWAAMITVAYMQVAYMLSALAWVLYLQQRRAAWLALSVVSYAIGLGSYEFGIGLPFVFLMLVPVRSWKRCAPQMAAFGAVIAVYLAWRFTEGFGMAHGVLFVPRKVNVFAAPIAWNAVEVARWWIGSHMFDAIQNGLRSFSTLAASSQRLLVVADLVAVFAVWHVANAGNEETPRAATFGLGRVFVFGLAWAVAGHALNLISWTAPRLNFFPAIGVAIALSALLVALPARAWKPWLAALAFVSLLANQGTAKAWQDSGALQRRLYQYIQRHAKELAKREVILVDTSALRQRITPGLVEPASESPACWAYYGNACLLRGFVPEAMVRMALPTEPRPRAILDVECDARVGDGILEWHEPWHPDENHRTAMERVVIVDAFDVGSGAVR